MKNLLLIAACAILFASAVTAQKAVETWGCPEKDYKCQLDGRMRALQADPKNPENYYNLGIVYQRSGAHKEAVEAFSMYITIPGLKPEMLADGYNNRAMSHRRLNRPDLAHADYTKAIERLPKKPDFLVNRGAASADMRKLDDALADFTRAIEIDPKFALAYAGRGNLYAGTSRYDEAIKDLSTAIELNPQNAEPYYTRAYVYRAKREFAKAIPDLDKYITLNPGNDRYLADGYLNRGIAYAVTGKPEQAEKDFSKTIELAPRYIDAYQARAVLYREMKKPDLAEADERKATELSGRSASPAPGGQTKSSFEYLAEGSKYYASGDYKRAIPPYQKALDLEKKEQKLERELWIVLVDNLGMAYGITGNIKSSFAVFEYGISKEPTYPLFYYNMACGYGELDDEDNAIKWLRPAFKHKANMLPGTRFPNPETDSSFAKFRDSEKFKKAIAEMKNGK